MGKNHKIPQGITRLPQLTRIPDKVGEIRSPFDPETKPFLISYEYYNDKLCEIKILEKNRAKQCLQDLRMIGKCNTNSLCGNGIDILSVCNQGDYSKLFNKLPPDIKLKEHKIQGDGRIFYFISRNLFHIVAITNNHLETNKHR